MKKLVPQNLTHRGTVSAEAFLLSASLLSEREMRRRALVLWTAGARIFRFNRDLIVHLPKSVRADTRQSLGLPFVRYGRILSAFPLEKKDSANFADAGECLVLLDKGAVQTVRLQDLETENVGEWFDVSDLKIVETETLGADVAAAPIVMKTVSEADLNLRENLKSVPQADAQLNEILAKLKELRASNDANSAARNASGFSGSASSSLTGFFESVFGGLKNLFASGGTSGESGGYTKSDANDFPNFAQTEPGFFSKAYNRLRHLTVSAVIEMRMARFFGRRQAKYLAEMMEKFERGDLAEALKYAIPLEDMQALRQMMEKPTALFAPNPRSRLEISFGQNTGGSSINLEAEWFERLRQLYRQSFERLEAQGRIEEAAFVLAELLKSNHEAVEFLARHGKYRVAAELAEARNLPKETVVRQWFLAGEKARAVRLAVLHDCFEYAVTKLEGENSETGAELREIWAETLAQSGNFPAAVDVIWKLEDKRARAVGWIEKTIEFGGAPAARMLARKTMLFPENFDEIKEKFREILSGKDFEAVEKRAAFARAVFKQKINDELRVLLRPLARKISNDAAENASPTLELKEFRELVVMAKDNALRTDLPTFSPTASSAAPNELFEITISAADKGASQIYDACVLPNERIAVALGEAGVKILAGDNRQIAYFDQPAHKLVVSDFANRAVALAARGDIFRLARIDFVERRASYWCDQKINAFAPNFDGSVWFIGIEDEFYAIDANHKNFEALWHVSDVGAAVHSAVRSEKQAKFLTLDAKGFETWWYELPGLTLRARNRRNWLDTAAGNGVLFSANISEGGYSVVIMQQLDEETKHPHFYADIFDHEHLARRFDFPPETVRTNRPEIYNQYAVLTGYSENQAVVNVFFGGGNLIAAIVLEAAKNVSVKSGGKFLTVADDCGRLLVYDYKNRALRQNLRL